MNRSNTQQQESVTYMKMRELMVLTSMVQGLKILKVTGSPTKERSCDYETAVSSDASPLSSLLSPQRKAKNRGHRRHGEKQKNPRHQKPSRSSL
jgi:hypothetical protein